jgi:hypothetical protein
MSRLTPRSITVVTALCVAGALLSSDASAQRPARSYSWYAELASVDRAAKTATLRVQVLPSVVKSASRFAPGDRVVLTWAGGQGEADSVIYIATPEVMKTITVGYLLPAEVVTLDAATSTITVKTSVPDSVLQTLASIQPGTWIKAAAPMNQPGPAATISSVVASAKPLPKPKPVEQAAEKKPAVPVVVANGGISGPWTVTASLGGFEIGNDCKLAQDGPRLGGTCTNMLGSAEVSGTVDGTSIKFSMALDVMGMDITLDYAGTIDAGGTSITGKLSAAGMESPFTATKK